MNRLIPLAACCCLFTISAAGSVPGPGKAQVIDLFNGKDLDGWVAEVAKDYKDGNQLKPVWSVKDGNIFCDGKGFGFLRYTRREFADFAMHVEYRMINKGKPCNSGVGIRTVPFDPKKSTATRPSFACYEIQLLNDAGAKPDEHSSGSLYRYVAPSSNPVKAAPEWNTLDVECVGPRIRVSLNGTRIIDFDQRTMEKVKNNPLKGYVCLQNHGGKLEFRNPRVTVLAPGPK